MYRLRINIFAAVRPSEVRCCFTTAELAEWRTVSGVFESGARLHDDILLFGCELERTSLTSLNLGAFAAPEPYDSDLAFVDAVNFEQQ